MSSRLHLARPAEIRRIDAQAVERRRAGNDRVPVEDVLELEWNRVER
jgi:hypothetical protein